ncbi:MAG: hypothetical protein F6K00_04940 [Leptolyngbya sp. SIOISBB]|nr:hypothetical protein [Leptolyngbya sp. SIOISBB]
MSHTLFSHLCCQGASLSSAIANRSIAPHRRYAWRRFLALGQSRNATHYRC